MRVYIKAKQLRVTSRSLLYHLARNGFPLPSASCNIPDEAFALLPDGPGADSYGLWFPPQRPDYLPSYPPWPQLVTGYQASCIARVKPATIRQWVRRGRLVQADLRSGSLHPMYHLDDVLAARLKTREVRRAKVPVYRVPKFNNQTYEGRATAREAAQFLNIPESTIRSWARRRRLVAVGQRGRWPLYELAAIYRLIKDRQRPELELPERPRWDDWD